MSIPKEIYSKILELIPIVCVDLVIIHNGKFFMAKRSNEPAKNQWFLPGGRIFKNESLKDAAMRKSKEETGLEIKIIKPVMFGETIFNKPSMNGVKSGAHTVNVVYLVEAKNDNVKLDNQNMEYMWTNQLDKKWHPYVKKAIVLSGVLNGEKK